MVHRTHKQSEEFKKKIAAQEYSMKAEKQPGIEQRLIEHCQFRQLYVIQLVWLYPVFTFSFLMGEIKMGYLVSLRHQLAMDVYFHLVWIVCMIVGRMLL